MELLHTSRFRVSTYDVGPRAEARPSALMNFLQEAAGAHVASCKLGVMDLMQHRRTWVLARYHLKLLRSPQIGDELQVVTWPSGRAPMFVTRDFEVRGPEGAPVAVATTSWAIVDVVQKKPVPLEDIVPADYQLPRRAIDDRFASLPRFEASEREVRVPVMLRDLDINRHVNHVVYVQWALESVPREVLEKQRLTSLEVTYRAEARYGDSVISRLGAAEPDEDGTQYRHQIVHADTGAELARLRTRWSSQPVS